MAALGQLTRLTGLHLSLDRTRLDTAPRLSGGAAGSAHPQLQLQLLGCSAAASAAGGDGGVPGRHSSEGSGPAAGNTGLQELTLWCDSRLSDDELAAAAGAMPELRRLRLEGGSHSSNQLRGLSGAGLAAFTACRQLRHLELPHGAELDGQQLVAQLPQLTSLTSVDIRECPGVDNSTVMQLQTAFEAKHGRPWICHFARCSMHVT
jgi:hypothetical protein